MVVVRRCILVLAMAVLGACSSTSSAPYGPTALPLSKAPRTVPGFRPSSQSKESVAYAFQGGNDGSEPYAGIIPGPHGVFYGTASHGGSSSDGTVFKLTPSGSGYTESVLHTFNNYDGQYPMGTLISDKHGALYGTTFYGGAYGFGTVFTLKPNGKGYRVLYSFNDTYTPQAGLYMDSAGALYGTTNEGGSNGYGIIFKLTPAGKDYTESVLHKFIGGTDGMRPIAPLIADAKGTLYGTTVYGGFPSSGAGNGTVFKLNPDGSAYKVLYAFNPSKDGVFPGGALTVDAKGALYGTTGTGYTIAKDYPPCCAYGTVFKLTPKGKRYTESRLWGFFGCAPSGFRCDGAGPNARLIFDAKGAIYGTTVYGGTPSGSGLGTVFKLTPKGKGYTESLLYTFQGGSDGGEPYAGLTMQSGALYSTTFIGGIENNGTVFRLSQ